jgi:hypothetical protein
MVTMSKAGRESIEQTNSFEIVEAATLAALLLRYFRFFSPKAV